MLRRWTLGLLLAAALASACGPGHGRGTTAATEAPLTVETYAARLIAQARHHEPSVTPLLLSLADEVGGEMVKLEHRFKTRESCERKIRAALAEDPTATVESIEIHDALRYTMRVDDTPPGRHVEAIRRTLAALEEAGHSVAWLKNYWPPDDNYSGVNTVMNAPDGFPWELQFHTTESLRVQAETRASYEELRRVDTPVDRQRELFDAMTRAWNEVAIPEGILEERSLHDHEEIRTRPRP